MTGAKYQRQRRAAARAKGMCGSCCTKRAAPGYACCADCRRRDADSRAGIVRVREAPQVPWCDECLLAGGGHRMDCPTRPVRQASYRRMP